MIKRVQLSSFGSGKQVCTNDVTKALQEMAMLRERLDWRRRDLRLMFIQSPELGRAFDQFQRAGGVTAEEWEAYMTPRKDRERQVVRPHVLRKQHLRLIWQGELNDA